MNEPAVLRQLLHPPGMGRPLWHEAALLAGRLGTLLNGSLPQPAAALQFFVQQQARAEAANPPAAPQPLDDLALALNLVVAERELLVLAGLPDEHAGHAAAFAALHPRGEPRPTWGLFCRLLGDDAEAAWLLQHNSALLRLGLVRLAGDGPLPERSLHLCEGLWPALHGLPGWPAGLAPLPLPPNLNGIDDWPAEADISTALTWLRGAFSGPPPTVLLRGLQPTSVRLRAQQLALEAGGLVFEWDAQRDSARLSALLAHTLLRRAWPALLCNGPLPAAQQALLADFPAPLLLAGSPPPPQRPLCVLDAPSLIAPAQAELWRRTLPELAEHTPLLAARYNAGPETLQALRTDLAPWLQRQQTPPLARCVAALKARLSGADEGFARRLQPRATWADLVLPTERLALLQAAVARASQQQRVLHDWGFGTRGAHEGQRGLRLLFCGLPGTGKTLAAEVLANALQADLLVIDLARLVSKWIGETEKHLAAVFEQAEATGAVLFFDEADALFGKRTEVSDAHDRHANIESSYLLARLERFDGVAVLATNLRANLDRAYLRRFELVLDFAEPGPAERAAIWRHQFPPQAPLAADVNFEQLAALHPLPGALIRHAALGAAYLAAAAGEPIRSAHIEVALRQEYEKSGRVSPH